MAMETPFSPYRLGKVSRKSVQPFRRTVVSYLCTIVVEDEKNRKKLKKKQKNVCKTYTHPRHLAAADA